MSLWKLFSLLIIALEFTFSNIEPLRMSPYYITIFKVKYLQNIEYLMNYLRL